MTGSFLVQDVGDMKVYGPFFSGSVLEGTLKPGMEARTAGLILVIVEIMEQDKDAEKTLNHARKGQQIILRPQGASLDALRALQGQILEFSDVKSAPLRGKLFLRPDLTES